MLSSSDLHTQQQNSSQISVYLEKIGGSNNSNIFELFGYNPNQYPRKVFSLQKVLKTVSHTCPQGINQNSQLKIHRCECYHLANEAQILSQLNHPNIIKPLDFINNNKEYCGLTLPKADFDLYAMIQKTQAKPDIKLLKTLFKQVLEAMVYLHDQNIAHNDIKLANLFIFKEKVSMVLADFGFAKKQTPDTCSSEEQYQRWQKRCLHTLAPEMIEKIKSQNSQQKYVNEIAADMFAFGITLFEAIFLMSPFARDHASLEDELYGPFYEGSTMQQLMKFWSNPNITQRLQYYKNIQDANLKYLLDLISKLLMVDPQNRLSAKQALEHPWFQL